MINELIKLIQSQNEELEKLLELLKTQYKMIMSKDVFGLEGLVDKISECGKRIAQGEVKRIVQQSKKHIKWSDFKKRNKRYIIKATNNI